MDDERFEWATRGRVPSLDGLRATSIGLVLSAHILFADMPPALADWRPVFSRLSVVGVDVFFVISGMLITLLLLREHDRAGRISLAGFYRRRVLRIVPAYAAYLAFVFVLARIGLCQTRAIDWAAACTYTINLMPRIDATWEFAHIWSLSVEEHFYLIWPVTVLVLGPRRAAAVLVAVVVGTPLLRFLLLGRWLFGSGYIRFATPFRMDTIAIGCLLAFLARHPIRARTCRGWRAAAVGAVGLAGLAACVLYGSAVRAFYDYFYFTVTGGCIAILVWVLVVNASSTVGRLLNWGPVVFVGILSYSLYLWQQPFTKERGVSNLPGWPLNVAAIVTCAVASHYLVERPFLRLRDRTSATAGDALRPDDRPA
ncbi:MAG TPA: acyltransferase [Humisphaera sp.]